jgi:NAD(P)-dependent dehydrogenase (short-subunit alcohol dehydrogenase family)
MTDHQHNPARRRLLLNAAAGTAAAALTASAAAASPSRKWDREADIVCDGSDGAGDDIADAVLWLASDAARYVSGSLSTVDGAFLAA